MCKGIEFPKKRANVSKKKKSKNKNQKYLKGGHENDATFSCPDQKPAYRFQKNQKFWSPKKWPAVNWSKFAQSANFVNLEPKARNWLHKTEGFVQFLKLASFGPFLSAPKLAKLYFKNCSGEAPQVKTVQVIRFFKHLKGALLCTFCTQNAAPASLATIQLQSWAAQLTKNSVFVPQGMSCRQIGAWSADLTQKKTPFAVPSAEGAHSLKAPKALTLSNFDN